MPTLIIKNVDLNKLEQQRIELHKLNCSIPKNDALDAIINMLDEWSDNNTCFECSSVLIEDDFVRGFCPFCGASTGEDYFDNKD
jgi:hypothetical protein